MIKERYTLRQIIEKNYAQYESAIQNNKMLENVKKDIQKEIHNGNVENMGELFHVDASTFSLSGDLTIDTLVYGYYREANANDIILDLCVYPMESDVDRDMKLATIIDELMELAIDTCKKCIGSKWIYFRINQDSNSVILKLEYSIPEGYKYKSKMLKLTNKLVSIDKGAMYVDNKEDEVSISILLP